MLSLKREQSDERTRWCPAWAFWDGSKGSMNACCRLSPRCGLGSGSSAVVAAEDGGVLGMEGFLRRRRCQGRMGRTRETEGAPPRPSPVCGGRGGGAAGARGRPRGLPRLPLPGGAQHAAGGCGDARRSRRSSSCLPRPWGVPPPTSRRATGAGPFRQAGRAGSTQHPAT